MKKILKSLALLTALALMLIGTSVSVFAAVDADEDAADDAEIVADDVADEDDAEPEAAAVTSADTANPETGVNSTVGLAVAAMALVAAAPVLMRNKK